MLRRANKATAMNPPEFECLFTDNGYDINRVEPCDELKTINPELLLAAAVPIFIALGEERGFTELTVFGSVTRNQARTDSDIDLLYSAADHVSLFDVIRLKQLFEYIVDRSVDLISRGGLKPYDTDILTDERTLSGV